MRMGTHTTILRMKVKESSLEESLDSVLTLAAKGTGGYICLSNVHMCMQAYDSPDFCGMLDSADLVLADGRPIFWAQRLLGAHGANQVRGHDLMRAVFSASARLSLRIGLYGGSSQLELERLTTTLMENYTGIEIAYAFSPPFRQVSEEEDRFIVSEINDNQENSSFTLM